MSSEAEAFSAPRREKIKKTVRSPLFCGSYSAFLWGVEAGFWSRISREFSGPPLEAQWIHWYGAAHWKCTLDCPVVDGDPTEVLSCQLFDACFCLR